MALKRKTPVIQLPSSLEAAASAAGGNVPLTGAKAIDAAPIDNTGLGLKDANGKVLPSTITGAQLKEALKNTKYNAVAIENLKNVSAGFLPINTSLSATGQINPTEINAITSLVSKGYSNTPLGTPVNILKTAKGLQDGTLGSTNPYAIPSTFSTTSLDRPNIEASKSTINDVFLSLLGRSATEKEIQNYTQKYINYAAKNPTNVSTGESTYGTVTVPTASGGTSSRLFKGSTTSTSVGNNLNEQEFLKNQVRQSGEYNAFTAAGSAFDMMTKMAQKDSGAM